MMNSRLPLVFLLTILSTIATAAPTSSWQLPTGYYVPAKMPMTIVYPRPDSETSIYARHRIAYADSVAQYRIPISVQGGAYPFHYQLTTGPQGATIGQTYGTINYGIVTWTPATGTTGNYTFTVQVTDQDGKTASVTWTTVVDNSKFIFVDPKAPTNGTGTKASPFNTVSGLTVAYTSGTPSPYYGKAIYFRSGTTKIIGPVAEVDPEFAFANGLNPFVLLGYTGETAVLDMSGGHFQNRNGQNDVFIGELTLANGHPWNIGGETDTVAYMSKTGDNRLTVFENIFTNMQWNKGAGASSNQAVFTFWYPGGMRKYITFINNTMQNSSIAMMDYINASYSVIQGNKFTSMSGAPPYGGFYLKASIQNTSVRENTAIGQDFGKGLVNITGQTDGGFTNGNIEVCYNLAMNKSGAPAFIFQWSGGGQESNTSPAYYWAYRNTFNSWMGGQNAWPYTVIEENNIHIDAKDAINGSGTYDQNYNTSVSGGRTINKSNNIKSTSTTGIIDSNGNLTGSTATMYGKVGAQIATNINPLSAPSWR